MLSRRFRDPIRVVTSYDEAVLAAPLARQQAYFKTRDIDACARPMTDEQGRDIPAYPLDLCTVFTASPLISEYDSLADGDTATHRWMVFAAHVTAISGFGDLKFTTINGRQFLADEHRNDFAPEIVNEIVTVIREAPLLYGSPRPFSLPHGWGHRASTAAMFRAAPAIAGTTANG